MNALVTEQVSGCLSLSIGGLRAQLLLLLLHTFPFPPKSIAAKYIQADDTGDPHHE